MSANFSYSWFRVRCRRALCKSLAEGPVSSTRNRQVIVSASGNVAKDWRDIDGWVARSGKQVCRAVGGD